MAAVSAPRNLARKIQVTYWKSVEPLAGFLSERGVDDVGDVRKRHVEDFIAHLVDTRSASLHRFGIGRAPGPGSGNVCSVGAARLRAGVVGQAEPVPADSDRARLAATFDQAAALYQQARPDYPRELYDHLVGVTGLSAGARLLEVGCATGKATRPLAQRGFAGHRRCPD